MVCPGSEIWQDILQIILIFLLLKKGKQVLGKNVIPSKLLKFFDKENYLIINQQIQIVCNYGENFNKQFLVNTELISSIM